MSEKACSECRLISLGPTCPNCKSSSLSDDFAGLVIVFDTEGSLIAQAMKIKQKGRYAVKVR